MVSKKNYNSENQVTDNPFEGKFCLRNISESVWLRNAINKLIGLFVKMRMTISSESLNSVKEELSMYYRLEHYECYVDIDNAKNYIQKIIDEYKEVLFNKKNESVTINGKELTYGEYISQLSDDQLEIFVQILHKKGTDSLTYGDLQKLSQIIEAQKKQGGTAVLLDCENLPGNGTEVIKCMNKIQKFINQKQEDYVLLDEIVCLDDIETKIKQLEKELTCFSAENNVSGLIASCKPEMIYMSEEKVSVKYDDKKEESIITPVSANEYNVITENNGVIVAVYVGKSQYLAQTYYRSASGHFYNKNGQEEKPSVLYNSDRTLRSVINYDSEEKGQKILQETVFANDDSKTISSVTHYKYDVNNMFMWKYTEVFDVGVNDGNDPSVKEKHYYNQAGNLCKTEKMYCVKGVNYCDIYGYSDGKINDNPSATYIVVNNKRKKI